MLLLSLWIRIVGLGHYVLQRPCSVFPILFSTISHGIISDKEVKGAIYGRSWGKCAERRVDTFVGRGPLGIAEVELAWRSLSNFSFTRESSVNKSSDVDCDILSGSFLTFGAPRSGSGFCRTGGINTQTQIQAQINACGLGFPATSSTDHFFDLWFEYLLTMNPLEENLERITVLLMTWDPLTLGWRESEYS